ALVEQLGVTDVTLVPGVSVALPHDGGSFSMSRPVSGTLKTTTTPALKNPLRVSTMSLLAPSTGSEEPGTSGGAAPAPAREVTAQQLRRMQIRQVSGWLRA